MSIVPFILDGDQSTIETNQNSFDPNDDKLLMLNLELAQINDNDDANTSYDLRVGSDYRDHREGHSTRLNQGDKIQLEPGSAIVIQTEEWVRFPNSRFGQILPKVKLLQDGVSNTTSKIDPRYNGYLAITLFNLGKSTITLTKGDKFCTLIVQSVLPGARPYNKPGKSIPNSSKEKGKWKSIKIWLERNAAFVTILGVVATFILTAVTIVTTIINSK